MSFHFLIRRSAYTSPVVVFVTVWSLTVLLYMLQLSNLLLYDWVEVLPMFTAIVLPFSIGTYISKTVNLGGDTESLPEVHIPASSISRVENLLIKVFAFWLAVTVVEIFYSRGVPMLWSLMGSHMTYFDYGIPTLHGLMNAVLLSIVTIATLLGLVSGQKRFFLAVIFLMVWGVVVISRNLIIVGTLQCLFVLFLVKGPPRGVVVFWLALTGLLAVIGFGWIGDLRSGANAFLALAQPSSNYPLFLPSGFLWVYIYISTPLNNLIHQTVVSLPEWNWGLTNSMALLLPSVLREIFYDAQPGGGSDLVTDAFNVSTAFLDMYRDLGFFGVVAMSFAVGTVSQAAYNGNTVRAVLFSAVLLQSAVLSIFFNHYFYLPILFQYPIIYLLSRTLNATAVNARTLSDYRSDHMSGQAGPEPFPPVRAAPLFRSRRS